MTEIYHYLSLPDGRTLEYLDSEVPGSSAVVFHQGTTMDAAAWRPWFGQLAERGIRAVAFNRSGYGKSSHKFDRRTIDALGEVAALADALSLTSFVSVGWSGGGSHAIATGLDPRCAGVVTLAGIAPYGEPDLNFLDGFKEADLEEYAAAFRSHDELIELIKQSDREVYWTPKDQEALALPECRELAEISNRRIEEFGWDFLRDDYSAYLNPWGFDVRDVQVPVILFQGDLDGNVPVGHARWLAQKLPNAELREKAEHGHISLIFTFREEILDCIAQLLSQ